MLKIYLKNKSNSSFIPLWSPSHVGKNQVAIRFRWKNLSRSVRKVCWKLGISIIHPLVANLFLMPFGSFAKRWKGGYHEKRYV